MRTPWSEFWRKFRKQPVALGALAFVVLLVLLGALLAAFVFRSDLAALGVDWAR